MAVCCSSPIEQAIIGHIRAAAILLDLPSEAFILRAHEALLCEMERDARFARRVQESRARARLQEEIISDAPYFRAHFGAS